MGTVDDRHRQASAVYKVEPLKVAMFDIYDAILLAVVIGYLIWCPYTKVEESFNIQAMHDMLFYGTEIDKYDHHEFPGVVPRTFLGSLLVTFLAKPLWTVVAKLGLGEVTLKFCSLLIVRGVLGLVYVYCTGLFRRAFSYHYYGTQSRVVAGSWTAILATQFHLNFYATRTLPNTFALCLVLVAYHFWFMRKYYHAVAVFTMTTVVFRGEVVVLYGPLGLELASRLPLLRLILVGAISGVVSLVLTVGVDSWFWQRVLWPEGEVLHFNTFLNQSSLWGTLPFHWYFSTAIPKAMLSSLLLVPLGLLLHPQKSLWRVFLPVLSFLFLYSFLPHKELRFIFYALPILNMVATMGLVRLLNLTKRWKGLVLFASFCALSLSLAASLSLGYMSHHNYPGGKAIELLHLRADKSPHAMRVHLDVKPCQSGFSRFLQSHPLVLYFKDENISSYDSFSHLITDKPLFLSSKNDPHSIPPDYLDAHAWHTIETIDQFSGVQFSNLWPFVHLRFLPSLFIYQRIGFDGLHPNATPSS